MDCTQDTTPWEFVYMWFLNDLKARASVRDLLIRGVTFSFT